MPHGKPAGVRCVQLTDDERCKIFDDPARPKVCASLKPAPSMCGATRAEAIAILGALEDETTPLIVLKRPAHA